MGTESFATDSESTQSYRTLRTADRCKFNDTAKAPRRPDEMGLIACANAMFTAEWIYCDRWGVHIFYSSLWNGIHHSFCFARFQNDENLTVKKQRWEIIQNALLQPMLTSRDLEKAILSYNTKYAKHWKFYALHELFEEVWTDAYISLVDFGIHWNRIFRNWTNRRRRHSSTKPFRK